MSATHRKVPAFDSFEVIRCPCWYSETPEVVLSSLTYIAALSNFEKLDDRESLVELFGIDEGKPPKLLKSTTRKKGGKR